MFSYQTPRLAVKTSNWGSYPVNQNLYVSNFLRSNSTFKHYGHGRRNFDCELFNNYKPDLLNLIQRHTLIYILFAIIICLLERGTAQLIQDTKQEENKE